MATASPARVALTGLDHADIYDLRIRYVTPAGVFSEAFVLSGYSTAAGTLPPVAVEQLHVHTVGQTSYLVWQMPSSTYVAGAYVAGFKLRFAADTGADWQSAADIGDMLPAASRSATVPARAGIYFIKAVDIHGRESTTAASVLTDVSVIDGYNAVMTLAAAPDFDGEFNDAFVADDLLQIDDGKTQGQYYFPGEVDLGQSYTSLVTAHIEAGGIDRAGSFDLWPDFDRIDNIDNNSAPGLWDVRLQISTTTDPRYMPAINHIPQPNGFDHADWVKTRSSISANTATAPDGTDTADKIVENTATDTHIASIATTAADNTPAAFAVYAKAAGRGYIGIYLSHTATGLEHALGATMDLSDGSTSYLYLHGAAAGVTVAAQDMGGGWWRFGIAGTVNPSGSGDPVYAQIRLADGMGSLSYTGDGTSGIYVWGAHVTQTSLPYMPVWSPWRDFVMGEYTARGMRFRALLSSDMNTVTPAVSDMRITIDMPDRTESGKNIAADPAGSDIAFDKAFRDTPALTITPQNMTTGDYYTITDITPAGFHIRFFNAAGGGISRLFDFVAKGFGASA